MVPAPLRGRRRVRRQGGSERPGVAADRRDGVENSSAGDGDVGNLDPWTPTRNSARKPPASSRTPSSRATSTSPPGSAGAPGRQGLASYHHHLGSHLSGCGPVGHRRRRNLAHRGSRFCRRAPRRGPALLSPRRAGVRAQQQGRALHHAARRCPPLWEHRRRRTSEPRRPHRPRPSARESAQRPA